MAMRCQAGYQKSFIIASLSFTLIACLGCTKKDSDAPAAVVISEATRVQAASTTATTNSYCTAIQPFYWEIGSATGAIGWGTAGGATPTASTLMGVASASKLLFASYVIEKKNGILTANDIKHLRFMSGYSTFTSCGIYATVGACYTGAAGYVAADDGKFFYSGGHFQKYASVDLGLSALNSNGLAAEMNTYLGSDVAVAFSGPQPAGGIILTPTKYALVLRKILNQQLKISNFLGTNSVCTNTISCASSSNSTPIPSSEPSNPLYIADTKF